MGVEIDFFMLTNTPTLTDDKTLFSFLSTGDVLMIMSLCFSLYLYKLGIAPQIQDLIGKVPFTGNSD